MLLQYYISLVKGTHQISGNYIIYNFGKTDGFFLKNPNLALNKDIITRSTKRIIEIIYN